MHFLIPLTEVYKTNVLHAYQSVSLVYNSCMLITYVMCHVTEGMLDLALLPNASHNFNVDLAIKKKFK